MAVRPGVLFGYYGDCETCIEETRDHVSMQWVAGWDSASGQIETIIRRAVKAAPAKTVIMLPGMYDGSTKRVSKAGLSAARAIFAGLHKVGALGNVVAVYPQDEPNLIGLSDGAVVEGNNALRAVMAEFNELSATALAVIYAVDGGRPGLKTYDWVGIDRYRLREGILNGPYRDLENRLRADQRLLLVPGSASPWKQDPKPFFLRAYRDPNVVAIVAFLWFDGSADGVGDGTRSNGMADEYRRWARQLGGRSVSTGS